MKACYRSIASRQFRKKRAERTFRRYRKLHKKRTPKKVVRATSKPALHRVTQVRDLKQVLRDFEPHVKSFKSLTVGRELSNFSLRPREAWANWLLCAVANFEDGGGSITFTTDPAGGDGLIRNRKSGLLMRTEHVSASLFKTNESEPAEEEIIKAISKKAKKGKDYALGKHLVVFSDAPGIWRPNVMARRIAGSHYFISVWVIALQWGGDHGYTYNITELDPSKSNAPVWDVNISSDFDNWIVTRVQ